MSSQSTLSQEARSFAKDLASRMSDFGIEPEDLLVKTVTIWDPKLCHSHSDLRWMPRENLRHTCLIDFQARLQEPYSNIRLVDRDELKTCSALQTVRLLAQHKAPLSATGIWAAAALVPLLVSSRNSERDRRFLYDPDGSSPRRYLDRQFPAREPHEAAEMALEIAGHSGVNIRDLWSAFHVKGLPAEAPFIIPVPGQTQTAPSNIIDTIAGLIAASLATHRPVRRIWTPECPDAETASAVKARLAERHAAKVAQRAHESAQRERERAAEAAKTPMQKRIDKLPYHLRETITPNAMRMDDLTDLKLLDLRETKSVEELAILHGVARTTMAKRIWAAQSRTRGVNPEVEERRLSRIAARFPRLGVDTLSAVGLALHRRDGRKLAHLSSIVTYRVMAETFGISEEKILEMVEARAMCDSSDLPQYDQSRS